MTRVRYRTKARHGSGKHDLAECSAQVIKIIEHGAKFCRDVKGNEISMKREETNRQATVVGKRLLTIASALLGEHRPIHHPHTQDGNASDRLTSTHPIPSMINNTTLLHSTEENSDNILVHRGGTRPRDKKAAQPELELQDLKIENAALKEELEDRQTKIGMLIFDLHFAGKALKTIAELRTSKMAQVEPREEVPLMLQERPSVEGDMEEAGEEIAEHGSGEEENEGPDEPADQLQDDIEVESVRLIGMEIAQRLERRENDILEVKVATLGDQLDKEKEDRVVKREALMGEKKATQMAMEKPTTDHRQEIKALMGQLQEAWNQGLDLTQQLNDANDHNRDLQLQLKEAQDALAESKRQFVVLRSENLLLQNEVYKLRLCSRLFKPGSGAVVKFRLKKQEIARMGTIARKDWSEVPKQVKEKGREAEDPSMVDADGGGPPFPVVALQTTTKEDITFKTEDPVVKLPALGVTKVLSPANTQSTHNALIPIPETTTIQPLDIEPQPIRVQLPDLHQRLSVGLHAEQTQHGKAPVTGLELTSRHWPAKNRLQSGLPHSSRTPLACITNQVVDRRCTVI